jgi:hypothetical protein
MLIKFLTLLMLVFTLELFVEISSLISPPILRVFCKAGFELNLGRCNIWNSMFMNSKMMKERKCQSCLR